MGKVWENEFLDYIIGLGYEYYAGNKVSNVSINDNAVSAVVNDEEKYKVYLEIKDGVLLDANCSCNFFNSNSYCKHVGAVLCYLNEHKVYKTSVNYNLKAIVNKIEDKELRMFLYNNLVDDDELWNKFRVEFSNYFPKLSKDIYKEKINKTIKKYCNKHGFIDYPNTSNYAHVMYDFIEEARKFGDNEDYETAFTIVMAILDSIPNTCIDDYNGLTNEIAESSIEIIFDILDEVDDNNSLLKKILDYVIIELKNPNLYNYGVDLKPVLEWFIYEELYLDEIKTALEMALDLAKDKDYFGNRKTYIGYLLKIGELRKEKNSKITILKKYLYDSDIFLDYINELIKNKDFGTAIKYLKEKLSVDDYESSDYGDKLAEIYLANNMMDEYKDILYQMFYKYDKYDIGIYRKIKKLYLPEEWEKEKNKIIEYIKNCDYFCGKNDLNKIFIEEKMYDELYLNLCDSSMYYIKKYERYLLPKYQNEVLNIYKKSCLEDIKCANNRDNYRAIAKEVNYIVKMDKSLEVAKALLKEINQKYFGKRPAMLDEFKKTIKNLDKYIE